MYLGTLNATVGAQSSPLSPCYAPVLWRDSGGRANLFVPLPVVSGKGVVIVTRCVGDSWWVLNGVLRFRGKGRGLFVTPWLVRVVLVVMGVSLRTCSGVEEADNYESIGAPNDWCALIEIKTPE